MNDRDITILLTFDVDAWAGWTTSLGARSPSVISRGEFSAVGVNRVLELLARRGLPATFFVPGHTARHLPRVVDAVALAGHEIAHHGWTHANPGTLEREAEERELEAGMTELERVTGCVPVGYRAPGWELSGDSVELLFAYGFRYDSSMMAGDYEPYWCRTGDRWTADGAFTVGVPAPLVELPVAWHRDDVPLFDYMFTTQLLSQGGAAPSAVAEIWQGDFTYLYDVQRNGMLVYTLHPEVIGHGHRLLMLDRLLQQMQDRPGARFETCAAYAQQWGEHRTPQLPAYLEPLSDRPNNEDGDER
jgi:peptidoglycan/xylan/chitin deacetylase (PgdA/CDA1 family)